MLLSDKATGSEHGAEWNAAIFTSRETPAIVMAAVSAAMIAARRRTIVDVLVNGNRHLAESVSMLCRHLPSSKGANGLRVWYISQGDKAHTWNVYVHRLWPGGDVTYFIDGYARVEPDALGRLAEAMSARPEALAGTGVPSAGRSAAALRSEMARDGGIHGNFFAIKNTTMQVLRGKGFHLPLGIYRTDATLGAALAFGLDPATHGWDPKQRIAVALDATWQTAPKRWWTPSETRAHLRRLDRQAQGALENRAVSDWLAMRKLPPHSLPRTASELVAQWAMREPRAFKTELERNRRVWRAWQQLQSPRDWSATELAPELLFDSVPND